MFLTVQNYIFQRLWQSLEVCRRFFLIVNLFSTGFCRKVFASHMRKQPLEMHVEASLVQPDHTFSGEPLLTAQYNDT